MESSCAKRINRRRTHPSDAGNSCDDILVMFKSPTICQAVPGLGAIAFYCADVFHCRRLCSYLKRTEYLSARSSISIATAGKGSLPSGVRPHTTYRKDHEKLTSKVQKLIVRWLRQRLGISRLVRAARFRRWLRGRLRTTCRPKGVWTLRHGV